MNSNRPLAVAFACCAVVTFLLLAAHPGADAGRLRDGLVHGGFIVVSAVLLVCFVFLSRELGFGQVAVVSGLVAFCLGSAALMSSMFLDGLLLPAIAARSDPRPFIPLIGSAISLLMPMGLLFQAAGVLCYSIVIVRVGRRAAGAIGLCVSAVMLSSPLFLPAVSGHVLIGGIALLCVWYCSLAVMLLAGSR
jgi:preprotein translocase subunit SecG